jgi:hypothetical protein
MEILGFLLKLRNLSLRSSIEEEYNNWYKLKDIVLLEEGKPIGPKSKFPKIWLRFD